MPAAKPLPKTNVARQQYAFELAAQLDRWTYLYTVQGVVANGATESVIFQVSQEANFKIETISAKFKGPVDANGKFVVVAGGIGSDFPNFYNTAFADQGLTINIVNQGNGQQLTSDFVDVASLLNPGYGVEKYADLVFPYVLEKNATFRWDIRNRDTKTGAVPLFHSFSIALVGRKVK